eukprot:tig00020904_g15282.t1
MSLRNTSTSVRKMGAPAGNRTRSAPAEAGVDPSAVGLTLSPIASRCQAVLEKPPAERSELDVEQLRDFVREKSFLKDFDYGMCVELLRRAGVAVARPGVPIFKQGDQGAAAGYVVLHGTVRCLTVDGPDGDTPGRTIEWECVPGQGFGHEALWSAPGPRSYSASAREPSLLLTVDRSAFADVIRARREREREGRAAILRGCAALSAASDAEIARIAEDAIELVLPNRQAVIREREPVDAVYIVVRGELSVSARRPDAGGAPAAAGGPDLAVGSAGSGELVGADDALLNRRSAVTVAAASGNVDALAVPLASLTSRVGVGTLEQLRGEASLRGALLARRVAALSAARAAEEAEAAARGPAELALERESPTHFSRAPSADGRLPPTPPDRPGTATPHPTERASSAAAAASLLAISRLPPSPAPSLPSTATPSLSARRFPPGGLLRGAARSNPPPAPPPVPPPVPRPAQRAGLYPSGLGGRRGAHAGFGSRGQPRLPLRRPGVGPPHPALHTALLPPDLVPRPASAPLPTFVPPPLLDAVRPFLPNPMPNVWGVGVPNVTSSVSIPSWTPRQRARNAAAAAIARYWFDFVRPTGDEVGIPPSTRIAPGLPDARGTTGPVPIAPDVIAIPRPSTAELGRRLNVTLGSHAEPRSPRARRPRPDGTAWTWGVGWAPPPAGATVGPDRAATAPAPPTGAPPPPAPRITRKKLGAGFQYRLKH